MALEYIHTAEGRIRVKDSYAYDYYLKDLPIAIGKGNTHVVFTEENGTATELQVSNYYPFGMRFNQGGTYTANQGDNNYLYNGKEFQEELDWYDYGARMYDAALGRFHTVDPLAEWHFNATPYHYCFNNPINLIDPFGMDTTYLAPPIPDIVVKAKRPNAWKRFWKKVGRLFADDNFEGNGNSQPSGVNWYTDDGGASPTKTKAKHEEDVEMVDATEIITVVSSQNKNTSLPKSDPSNFGKGVKRIGEAGKEASKVSSDKGIMESNTGISDKRTANGAQSVVNKGSNTHRNATPNIANDTVKGPDGEVWALPGDTLSFTIHK